VKANLRRFLGASCVALQALLPLRAAEVAEPFKIGVAPHTSARFILEQYQPLRMHLAKALGVEVEIVTAPDFTDYARQAIAQKFDLAVTTGHQARLLQADFRYIPLITYKAAFKSLVITTQKGGIRTAKDLNGTTVIGLSPTSLVTLWGQHWLDRSGCKDVTVRYVSAADSVAQLLLSGEGTAGFVSLPNFQNLAPEVQTGLRVLAESPALAGRVYVLNARQRARRAAVEAALWSFAGSAEGKRYLEKNKLEGYRKLKKGELEAMDPFADEVRRNLGLK